MTIGREPGNDIVLSAPAVSRYHAEVEKVGQRYRVRDLRSSNGTYVNGKAITARPGYILATRSRLVHIVLWLQRESLRKRTRAKG